LIIIHMKKTLATTPEIDAAIASTQMVLLAETLGLGTCYIGFLIWAIENSGLLKKRFRDPAGEQGPDCLHRRLPRSRIQAVRGPQPGQGRLVGRI